VAGRLGGGGLLGDFLGRLLLAVVRGGLLGHLLGGLGGLGARVGCFLHRSSLGLLRLFRLGGLFGLGRLFRLGGLFGRLLVLGVAQLHFFVHAVVEPGPKGMVLAEPSLEELARRAVHERLGAEVLAE